MRLGLQSIGRLGVTHSVDSCPCANKQSLSCSSWRSSELLHMSIWVDLNLHACWSTCTCSEMAHLQPGSTKFAGVATSFVHLHQAPDGSLTPLAARNIDTGLGLERMAHILQVTRLLSGVEKLPEHGVSLPTQNSKQNGVISCRH